MNYLAYKIKIILYDLTNTYFEGRKPKSTLAKFGKSKEQRKNAKLVVLAMVVNIYGFIKRPIYHKNDDPTMAHPHLGLMAYWLVNTIKHQLKAKNINHNWKEITRISNTQKVVYSLAQNTADKDTIP